MKKPEMKQYYSVARNKKTEVEWIVEYEVVEELHMTWSEAVKYAKKKYGEVSLAKRQGTIYVR